jgi:hypothetical protein
LRNKVPVRNDRFKYSSLMTYEEGWLLYISYRIYKNKRNSNFERSRDKKYQSKRLTVSAYYLPGDCRFSPGASLVIDMDMDMDIDKDMDMDMEISVV